MSVGSQFSSLNVEAPVESQTAIIGSPLDLTKTKSFVIDLSTTWCGPCRQFLPHLIAFQNQFPSISFLQISNEPSERLTQFFGPVKDKIPFSVCSVTADVWESVSNAFSVRGIPHVIVVHDDQVMYSGHPAQPEFQAVIVKIHAANTSVSTETDA